MRSCVYLNMIYNRKNTSSYHQKLQIR